MITLLDTNVCIAYLSGTDESVLDRIRSESPAGFRLCSVVKAELLYGARKSQQVDANLSRLATFFAAFESLPFDDAAAVHYGIVRAQLAALGTPIGANDLMIASIALASDAIVATRNLGEFRRVPGLRVDGWN